MKRLYINPRIGDKICRIVEKEAGEECHVIIIAFPMEGEKLGQPAFVTSLMPDDFKNVMISVAGNIAIMDDPKIDGMYIQ